MKTIRPSKLNGTIRVQPSKSELHRLLICAALAEGKSVINNFMLSDDIEATLRALSAMGVCEYKVLDDRCAVMGGLRKKSKPLIDCGESGTTLRLLLPLALDGQKRVFTGHGKLMRRPMEVYDRLFSHIEGYRRADDQIYIQGRLAAGQYRLRGDVSSQFVSGLLLKLPLLDGDSEIGMISPLESKAYVDLTRAAQEVFGVQTDDRGGAFFVKGGQAYRPCDATAGGDYSHAAFFAVAAAVGGSVTMRGLDKASYQGDKQIFEILRCMGANVEWRGGEVTVSRGNLKPVEVDVSQIPDLVPALAVAACGARGTTALTGARRLRFKESDRLHAMAQELENLGASVAEYEDTLRIHGTGTLRGGSVHTHNDHRVAMALAVASGICEGNIILDEPEVVKKSAPGFFDEFRALGGNVL